MSVTRRFLGREGEGGQAIVLIAITFLAMLMIVGLAVDAGQLYAAKRTEQEAADAGAFAGAVVLYQGGTTADAFAAAIADATKNGFTDGLSSTTVTVNVPPTSGLYQGNNKYVEVTIVRQVRTALVPAESLFNPVRARGVAGAEALNNGYAIMALDRGNTSGALSASSNADIHLTGGGIMVNSSNSQAAQNSQSNNAKFTITPSTFTVDINGGTTSLWPSQITVNTGVVQKPDPFAGYPKPSTAGLPTCNSLAACTDANGNLIPGIYTVSLSAAGGTTLHLNSGIYILKAGLNGAGNADFISEAGGVFIFNTNTNYPASGGSCGGLSLVGNATTDLRAMTSGQYANFLFYQDPACSAEMVISGNGTFYGQGTVYLPSAHFRFNGNNATFQGSQLVAATADLQNGNITINFDPATTVQPILPRLAE